MARIMIVDDDSHVVEVIERSLRRRGHVVIVARNGQEAIRLLQVQSPDLIILDIVMPRVNGIEVCRFARSNARLVTVPILFLTVKEHIEDKITGFEAGGDDYLTKPFNLEELELRVRALLRYNDNVAPSGRLHVGIVQVDPANGEALIGGKPVELTSVEFELFYYMVSHHGQVLPTERLLQDVWGYPPGTGNASLVRMHVLNLRRKIEDDPSSPQILRTIPRHGYTLIASPQEVDSAVSDS
ncbi:MAG TPA: response regulator transcription factor [Chloroflexi bacterium]|jgi:DNA-binding response OmpR family regulator|nr:response regulator transcription factor [Chloroflexota bacterium]